MNVLQSHLAARAEQALHMEATMCEVYRTAEAVGMSRDDALWHVRHTYSTTWMSFGEAADSVMARLKAGELTHPR